jgi:hypothetical protein
MIVANLESALRQLSDVFEGQQVIWREGSQVMFLF